MTLQSSAANAASEAEPRSRHTWRTLVLLWAGWVLPQLVLFGPALIGQTVLSPVDLLATPTFYLPDREVYRDIEPRDNVLSDLVLVCPAAREFCATEFRAGRLPLWQPANYCGAPFAAWPKYSPFEMLYTLFPTPVTLAWIQLLQALTAGSGMYLLLRRGIGLAFWPSAVSSWCLPLVGFLVLWQGYPVSAPVCWLPWLLWTVAGTLQRPFGGSNLAMALVTGVLLLSGAPDVGGLVLLTSGLYALWQIACRFRTQRNVRQAFAAAGGAAAAWALGFLLAAPYLLPLVEYSKTGARMQARATGMEERPPVGLPALPAILLPDAYGSTRSHSYRIVNGNQMESSSAAYAGLVAMLWLMPLAWSNRRRREATLFWVLLAALSLGWQLNVPGLVHLLRLPPLNMLSYNRWVFATGLSVLVLAAIGLEQLALNEPLSRRWFLFPMGLTTAFGVWCLIQAIDLPEPIRSELPALVRKGEYPGITPNTLLQIQLNFAVCYQVGAVLSLIALIGWGVTVRGLGGTRSARLVIPIVLVGELVWFASHEVRDGEPTLYFPRVEALERLAQLPTGRILGAHCLPPNLNQSHGLWDIRGYDAVDPAGIVKLLDAAHPPESERTKFATTQWLVPGYFEVAGRQKVSPIFDLLNVRYFVVRQPPPIDLPIVIQADDYWVLENPDALPRAFVPGNIQIEPDDDSALAVMAKPEFNPRERAFVHDHIDRPPKCEGSVSIRRETPTRVELVADMTTDGVVILSDLWDPGWHAELDGHRIPIHRANVALRGLMVPRGHHEIVLTYWPASVRRGLQCCLVGGLLSLVWCGALMRRHTLQASERGRP